MAKSLKGDGESVMRHINTLTKHILSFCDENVQDIPEGRLFVAILAQAFADMGNGDWLARRWVESEACEGLCGALGLSYLSVLTWSDKYEFDRSTGHAGHAAVWGDNQGRAA